MRARVTWPPALTVAGADSGGGAGIQADLKTFFSLRVHGCAAITCLTAQNPRQVSAIEACSPRFVRAQITAIRAELSPAAIKTGMLFNSVIIRAVAESLSQLRAPIVVDPVMVATSGARLLQDSAIAALRRYLFPLATLVTPNLDEASVLLEQPIRDLRGLQEAARRLHRKFGCAFLVKGGHLRGLAEAVDVYYDGDREIILKAPFVKGVSTHGTGCTYSAAITAYCARGESLINAVRLAKKYITRAIAHSVKVRKHGVLAWISHHRR